MAKRIKVDRVQEVPRESEAVSSVGDCETAAKASEAPSGRYLVTFNPPSPVGPRARQMEVAANSATEALAIWRKETGFTGATAVAPVVTEITGGEETPAEE